MTEQTPLFDGSSSSSAAAPASDEQLALYALGDFQARGKVLAERDLPLDRLRGALKRAADVFGITELEDERACAALQALGARIKRVPAFVAKHPYRVIVPAMVAERARDAYRQMHEASR